MSLGKSSLGPVEPIPEWPIRCTAKQASFADNFAGNKKVFQDNSRRLFTDSATINLEACTVSAIGCKAEKLNSTQELEVFLAESEVSSIDSHGSIPASKLFFLSQPTSRARFSISETAMKTLLVYIGVFSPFTNIISCFGFEKGPNQDGRGGFYDRTSTTGLVLETAYTLKHVEHKAGSAIPFSIRQMGIYQNFNLATKTSSNILIQSSQNVQREVLRLVQEGTMATFPDHWKNVHEIHLSSLSNNWIDYIKFLESKMSDIEDAVRFAKRDTPDRVTFETLQRLSKYRDIMIRIAHTLDANIAALNRLLALARKRQKKCESKEPAEEDESFSESIQTCIVEQEMLKHHVGLVESSSQELGALVRNTITLTDGNVMLTLTQKTIQEARTMRTITFIALIYLPASFTSTFLSMGFVHVESLDGIMRLNVSKDMLFYVAITVPLMVVTISAWWLWEYMSKRRKRISREEGDEEKAKDL